MNPQTFNSSILQALGVDDVPFGNNLVLTGPAGVGKSIFCTNLTRESLREEEGSVVIFATFDVAPKDIRAQVSDQRPACVEPSNLIFIDWYSWLLGETNENHHVSHLSNLNDLSVKIYNALNETEGNHHIFLFDSDSTLFVYNAENEVIRFLQINMARVKQSGNMAFWTVGENIHTSTFYNFLRHLADGVIEMRFEEHSALQRFIRVHTLKGMNHKTDWFQFEIQDKGTLIIKSG